MSRIPPLSTKEKDVLNRLLRCTPSPRECKRILMVPLEQSMPSVEKIASTVGCDRKTVSRSIRGVEFSQLYCPRYWLPVRFP